VDRVERACARRRERDLWRDGGTCTVAGSSPLRRQGWDDSAAGSQKATKPRPEGSQTARARRSWVPQCTRARDRDRLTHIPGGNVPDLEVEAVQAIVLHHFEVLSQVSA